MHVADAESPLFISYVPDLFSLGGGRSGTEERLRLPSSLRVNSLLVYSLFSASLSGAEPPPAATVVGEPCGCAGRRWSGAAA
eukprot:SAG11_NODE_22734_length_401_cov_0.685430_1_plen_81_part_01